MIDRLNASAIGLNGGNGQGLPTELSNKYPTTVFKFARRGAKGADVEVIGGDHPSLYPGSTWSYRNNYGDFKPSSISGVRRFLREIKKGKLPSNTEIIEYDTKTGKIK